MKLSDLEGGWFDKQGGYWRILIDGKRYKRSRLVWIYHNGAIPDGMQIDHINHNRQDDRIENLRIVTSQENNRNRSGVKGVSWNKKAGKWEANLKIDKKKKHLGLFVDWHEAIYVSYYTRMDNGFHHNHGSTL